jgi:subtilisin family serine protease
VDPLVAATRAKVTPELVYRDAINGYAAPLTSKQLNAVTADPATLGVQQDVILTAPPEQPAEAPPPQFVSVGIRRVGGLASPTAKIDGIDERVDVDVAVIDDGIDVNHPDLNVAGVVNCIHPNRTELDMESPRSGPNIPGWHGTMVAGFVGAIDNAFGAVGIAPGARIWGVQSSTSNGNLTLARILCGLNWVAAHADTIEVVNMSFGGSFKRTADCVDPGRPGERKGQRDVLHEAVCAVDRAGVTMVAAAGNESTSAPHYPATYDEVIAVSAIGDDDGLPGGLSPYVDCPYADFSNQADDAFAFFSNYGPWVDIAAPGVCISSTYPGGLYGTSSGTSFATPIVAGAAALYLATHPGATPAQVRAALLATAEPGPIPGDPDTFPEGIVNVSTL